MNEQKNSKIKLYGHIEVFMCLQTREESIFRGTCVYDNQRFYDL